MVVVGKLAGDGSGTGGYSAVRITAVRRPETGRYSEERITVWIPMAILDNLYRKCYNKCNDDNKKAISHQSPKFALYGVFAFMGIKSRRTPKNAVQAIYIKTGNTKSLKLCAVQGQLKKAYLYISKGAAC